MSEQGAAADPPPPTPDRWRADFRTPAMHDRDRILYSSAFQRLAYVTQVTAPESGITFHNRLSHSLKVAQVGRRNAERLRALEREGEITGTSAELVKTLSPDAVEAACLGHDLGHPPFGHIAEEVLQKRAGKRSTGDRFEGNAQSFRIVTRLAQRTAGRPGLDLTRRTLDGLLKYPWRHGREGKKSRKWGYYAEDLEAFRWVRPDAARAGRDEFPDQSLEAAIMEWADDVTYAVHDVDDFFRAGLLPLDRLGDPQSDEMKTLHKLFEEADGEEPNSLGASPAELTNIASDLLPEIVPNGPYRHTYEDRRDMKRRGSDLITRYLSAFRVEDTSDGRPAVVIGETVQKEVTLLKALVRVYVIRRPGLAVVQHGQKRVIRELFDFYLEAADKERGDLRLFPPAQRALLNADADTTEKRVRLVIDLIAGLTEQSAIALHQRMIGGSTAPTMDATAAMA